MSVPTLNECIAKLVDRDKLIAANLKKVEAKVLTLYVKDTELKRALAISDANLKKAEERVLKLEQRLLASRGKTKKRG